MSYRGGYKRITDGSNTTDLSSYPTATITLRANRLYFLTVCGSQASGNIDTSLISASGGGTWAVIDHDELGGSASTKGGALMRCVPTAGYTGTVTITFGATQTAATWALTEVTRADTGNNGADAVVQAVKVTPAATVDPAVTLGALANVDNGILGFCASDNSSAGGSRPHTAYTERYASIGAPQAISATCLGQLVDTLTVTFNSNALSLNAFIVGVEIKHDGSAATEPNIRSVGTYVATATAATVVLPAHATDDILLVGLETVNGETPGAPGGGWAETADSPQDNATNTSRMTLYWKRATSAAEANPVFGDAGNHIVALALAVKNCRTSGDPWDVTSGGTHASGAVSVTGDTTTVPATMVIHFVGNGDNNTTIRQFTDWLNVDLEHLIEVFDATDTIATGGGFGIARGIKPDAGAFGVTSVTVPNGGGGHITLALVGLPNKSAPPTSNPLHAMIGR